MLVDEINHEPLADELKKHIADAYVLFTKAAGFHWNIEGDNFPQYHEFLGELYADIYSSIDRLSEYVRTLDVYALDSLADMLELTQLKEQTMELFPRELFTQLYNDIDTVSQHLEDVFDVATEQREQGIANFIADRLDAYGKHNWMIKSILKKIPEWTG